MKKPLLCIALLIGSLTQLNAQCVITPGCTPDPTLGYCTTPTDNTPLPNASESSAYSTTIQLSIGTTAFMGFITVTSASLTSVTGLPAGLSYSSNPANGYVAAGSNACLLIDGTPAMGSAGTYTIDANFDVVTSSGPISQAVSWTLQVDATGTVGIKTYNASSAFFLAPNPATNELAVSAAFNFGKVSIIDALGKTVISHDANNSTLTKINISDLSKGVYFLQMNDGTRIVTRKFIKE